MSWMFGKPPIREQNPAKESLCGNPEDILLDLSGTKKVSGCKFKNTFWHAESLIPDNLHYAFCQVPLKKEKRL